MRIKNFSLNSEDQVVVKIVKEVLNLFKMEIDYDETWENWDIESMTVNNTLIPSQVPIVHTEVIYQAPSGEQKVCTLQNEGHSTEHYSAGKHRLIKLNLYRLFRQEFGFAEAPWGIMHGVRPTKIVHRLLGDGLTPDEVKAKIQLDYEVSNQKATTITNLAVKQQPFLAQTDEKTISIYVGIPFCLSRCLYCSFPANVLPSNKELDKFMVAFYKDMAGAKKLVDDYGYKVQSIYVGGGTPTSLPDEYFAEMLHRVQELFKDEHTVEFTVEAGRPDSMSPQKYITMKECGVTRVSCNPQTMQQRTLKRIGRNHSPEDIVKMYHDLRQVGIPEINMDLIIGLPGEVAADVKDTMEQILALEPDDITLHSLALKRGSVLKMNLEQYELPDDDTCRELFNIAMDYVTKAGLEPYYLYRQGYMKGQMENVGCSRHGAESMYNIQIMEEHQTIIGIGGAATSKIVDFQAKRLKSSFNAKDLITYIRDIDIYIEKRRLLLEETYGKPQGQEEIEEC